MGQKNEYYLADRVRCWANRAKEGHERESGQAVHVEMADGTGSGAGGPSRRASRGVFEPDDRRDNLYTP